MQISVIICTSNRCDLLRSTLESLCSMATPSEQEWEIVVVDNNSLDSTAQVVCAFERRLPLRYVLETELGISKARNTGVQAAKGELLLFLDDDVSIEPDWMQSYIEAAEQWPEALYFGGIIYPAFASKIPAWVERNQPCLNGMLCSLDLGPNPRPLATGEFPYGPNMAARRQAFALAGFNEGVGRKGSEQIRGCETSLFLALERKGASGAWVPGAKVHHYITPHQMQIKYLWRYYYGLGRAAVRLGRAYRDPSRRHLMDVGVKSLIRFCLRPKQWPLHLSHVARMSGQYHEARQLSLQSTEAKELNA